ncbi:exonuclease SbcCD subunit D [Jeotgalibaca caeni]|uniref:exonuclease SbcCD subunit D n=1 Tax=Jeotgalibaca caeni TaxID=3028623 RepID=UPI00237E95AE|nr:exonuclease SbcCD subunit D [Jeotgalibaca caeni]MDE1549527.1 exonuclease SbcCD subunit D [Jeotgalibaca caeni]
MRILHTADWHLGKIVNDYSMLENQRHYLNELLDAIQSLQVEAVIMAGDLYDRSMPPKEAVALADEILTRIVTELKIPLLVISGNHDSQERLEYGSRLFTENKLYMEGTVKTFTRKVTIQDTNFYLIPFGDPVSVREVVQEPSIRTMEDVARYQMKKLAPDFDPTAVNILVSHGYVINGSADSIEESDSERPLSIGTAEYVPVELLEHFDYVALGHIHKAQKVKHHHVRYSGSILKYSKSEARHQKQSLLLDITKDDLAVEPILIKPLRDMRILRGTFSELIQSSSDDYIFFELEDDGIILDPMNQLRRQYPHAMGLEYVNRHEAISSSLNHTQADIEQKSLMELFTDFYTQYTKNELHAEDQKIIEAALATIERSQE